jgi:ankyrin repeat protein
MVRPEELTRNEPLLWSAGNGTEVWDLFCACAGGDVETVERLVGANPSLVRAHYEYRTPLYFAVRENKVAVARFLLDRGANPFYNGEDLIEMARIRRLPDMETLIESHRPKSRANQASAGGVCAALADAAGRGELDVVRTLLERGADPNAPEEGNAPHGRALHAAVYHRHVDVRLMLQLRPGVVERVAVAAKSRELTELLFQRGMNPNLAGWLGVTPLHRFARQGDLDSAAVFLDHGANLHTRDEEFCTTPLGYAAAAGKRQMVEFLLERGAKVRLPDDPAWATPIALAAYRGRSGIVRVLKAHATR